MRLFLLAAGHIARVTSQWNKHTGALLFCVSGDIYSQVQTDSRSVILRLSCKNKQRKKNIEKCFYVFILQPTETNQFLARVTLSGHNKQSILQHSESDNIILCNPFKTFD